MNEGQNSFERSAAASCPDCDAIQWGNALCETCRSHWTPEPDHFEGNIGANIAGGRYCPPMSAKHKREERPACTLEQAKALLHHVERGERVAATVGIGSNGHPPDDEMWIAIHGGSSWWVSADGTERKAP